MKLYVVRHGQTLFNVKGRIQGWCDSALTVDGRKQAEALSKGLHNVNFTAAYASTSERAIDTANLILNQRNIEVNTLKGLKEMNFGTIEGEYEKDYLAPDGSSHDKGFVEFGGENIAMTTKRLVQTIKDIVKQHNHDDTILIVSHGGAIMCLLLGLFDMQVQAFRAQGGHIQNCSVTEITFNETFELLALSDITYRDAGLRGEN